MQHILFSLTTAATASGAQRLGPTLVGCHNIWRSLALSAPELWTNIPFNYPRWAEEMLTRSKMVKLTLQVDLEYRSTFARVLDPIKICLSQITRLEEINISHASGSVLEKLFQRLTQVCASTTKSTTHFPYHKSATQSPFRT